MNCWGKQSVNEAKFEKWTVGRTEPRSRLGCDARRKVGQWASGSVDAFLSFPPHFLSENKAFVLFKESIFFVCVFFLETQRDHHGEAKKLCVNPGRKKHFLLFPVLPARFCGPRTSFASPGGSAGPLAAPLKSTFG